MNDLREKLASAIRNRAAHGDPRQDAAYAYAYAALAVFKEWLEGEGRWHSYLNAFSYDDVESGDLDDYTPKIGDFVYLHHQRDHDGYETDNTGQIVEHCDNGVPVAMVNLGYEKDGTLYGDYCSLTELFISGWTLTRVSKENVDIDDAATKDADT